MAQATTPVDGNPLVLTSAAPKSEETRVIRVSRFSKSITADGQVLDVLMKDAITAARRSAQGALKGEVPHPFDRLRIKELQIINEHHAACLHCKTSALVGLGFLTAEERTNREKRERGDLTAPKVSGSWKFTEVDKTLNPLCRHSFQDVLWDAGEDYWEVGDGSIEVVRQWSNNKIVGLYHIPATDIRVYNEDNHNYHFVVQTADGHQKRFATFGDGPAFEQRRNSIPNATNNATQGAPTYSEVIHIRRPSTLSKEYGFPDWISATAAIELIKANRQYRYDFYNNRGVPEFMLFITGQMLTTKEWEKIETALMSNIGQGNSFKSLAVNLPYADIKVEVHKLGVEAGADAESQLLSEGDPTSIVTAHGVPPLLAGILIPGKLGSTNELPNALRAFQALRVGSSQKIWMQRLGGTLGDPSLNGGLGLKAEDFTLRRIVDELDIDVMDTSARMRETEPEAAASGRDLRSGLRD